LLFSGVRRSICSKFWFGLGAVAVEKREEEEDE
jgi:hypothetical protein